MSKTELIIFPTELSPPPKCPFPGPWQHCQLRHHVRKQEASHIPLSFPWSSSVRRKLPILSCIHILLPVWFRLSRYLETASRLSTISPPLTLPSNPPFITTRVSFLKHISVPVFLLLKAFHPTAHKRTSTWSTKHANLFWFCPISQHSPQSNLLST